MSICPAPDYRAVMPFLRLSKAIATIGFLIKTETWNTTHVDLYRFNRQFFELLF